MEWQKKKRKKKVFPQTRSLIFSAYCNAFLTLQVKLYKLVRTHPV